jgi:MGT family glycosyltransferase
VRVIASFVGGWGHAEPLLPLAAWASRLGHHVSFAGQAALRERLVAMGYGFDVVGPDTLATKPQPLVPVDREAERIVMCEHFMAHYGRIRAALLGELFDRERVEMVISDEVDFGAVIAAERHGIPCVTVNVIAAGLLTSPSVVAAEWRALRRDHGLAPDPGTVRIGGDVVIAPLPRSLRSPEAPALPTTHFVRPPILDHGPPASETGAGRSLVYVTLGTVFNLESGDLLTRLVRAMNRLSTIEDLDVVITTGPNVRADQLPPPAPGVRIEAFVPQRELLGRCRAVVCHAGSGTIVDALSLGIPIVALPLGADQPDNADRCEALGAGVTLDPITATIDQIADATNAVLHDSLFIQGAGALAAEARTQPGLEGRPELRRLLGT